MPRQRRARIKVGDDGNYFIGLHNGMVATVDQDNPDHAKLTELLDRIEHTAQPSPEKIAAQAMREQREKELEQLREQRRAEHLARINAIPHVPPAKVARKEPPGKRMWEMVLLGRRIGPMGR